MTFQPVSITETDRASKDDSMYTHYIEAVSIENQNRGNKQDSQDDPSNETTTPCSGLLTFNTKDYNAIRVTAVIIKMV